MPKRIPHPLSHAIIELIDPVEGTTDWFIRKVSGDDKSMARTFALMLDKVPGLQRLSADYMIGRIGISNTGSLPRYLRHGPGDIAKLDQRDSRHFRILLSGREPMLRISRYGSDHDDIAQTLASWIDLHEGGQSLEALTAQQVKRIGARDRQRERRLEAKREQSVMTEVKQAETERLAKMDPDKRKRFDEKKARNQSELEQFLANGPPKRKRGPKPKLSLTSKR